MASKQIIEKNDGKLLLIKPVGDKTIPLFCDICKFPMKTLEDIISFKKIDCCAACEMRWSNSKLGNLKDGWKPNEKTDGWEEYIQIRNISFKSLINLK